MSEQIKEETMIDANAFDPIGMSPRNNNPSRPSSRQEIEVKIAYHKEMLNGLERLLACLPEDLNPEADAALWKILTNWEGRGWRYYS